MECKSTNLKDMESKKMFLGEKLFFSKNPKIDLIKVIKI